MTPSGSPVLHLQTITAGYGRSTVLRDVELTVTAGQIVALLGANGAGKTTLMRTAAGSLRPIRGRIWLDGRDVTRVPPEQRSRQGLCLIPEGRGIFPNLSVRENLLLQCRPAQAKTGIEAALNAFPDLRGRQRHRAGSLSGGQQQMLALARCFSTQPRVVLLDEVSMGLAPKIIDQIFRALGTLSSAGIALLVVEQYISRALAMADQIYVLDRGQVSFTGSPKDISEAELMQRYLNAGNTVARASDPGADLPPDR